MEHKYVFYFYNQCQIAFVCGDAMMKSILSVLMFEKVIQENSEKTEVITAASSLFKYHGFYFYTNEEGSFWYKTTCILLEESKFSANLKEGPIHCLI